MQIVVLADDGLKQELTKLGVDAKADIIWIHNADQFSTYDKADAFIDLLFENENVRVELLNKLLPAIVMVNSVVDTLEDIGTGFIRINAWPGFLESSLVEASAPEALRRKAEHVFSLFNKKPEWLPDEPGFISARVISMIINEAYLSLKEGVSTKEEIDTAMKLGTNYPYGPFEWGERIGMEKVRKLIMKRVAAT